MEQLICFAEEESLAEREKQLAVKYVKGKNYLVSKEVQQSQNVLQDLAVLPCSQDDMWTWTTSLCPLLFFAWGQEKNHGELHCVLQLGQSEDQDCRALYHIDTRLTCWPHSYCCAWRNYHHFPNWYNIAIYYLYCSNYQDSQTRSMNHIMPSTAQIKRKTLAPVWRPFVSQGVTWPQT